MTRDRCGARAAVGKEEHCDGSGLVSGPSKTFDVAADGSQYRIDPLPDVTPDVLIDEEDAVGVGVQKLFDLLEANVLLVGFLLLVGCHANVWINEEIAGVRELCEVVSSLPKAHSVLKHLIPTDVQQPSVEAEIVGCPLLEITCHGLDGEVVEQSRALEGFEEGTFPVVQGIPEEIQVHCVRAPG